jgi:phage-related protein
LSNGLEFNERPKTAHKSLEWTLLRANCLRIDTIFCIVAEVTNPKPLEFRGTALVDLRTFPPLARRDAGHQLDRVQNGYEPEDWKPMSVVGSGVQEIRIRDAAGAFRVLYVAKFAAAVYVLHCFQKKTQQTSKTDLDLAAKRYRELVKELRQ